MCANTIEDIVGIQNEGRYREMEETVNLLLIPIKAWNLTE